MNRDDAKKISLQVAKPRTALVLFDETGHKILGNYTVRQKVECGTVIDVDGVGWKVVGWGPTDDTNCRAICRLA